MAWRPSLGAWVDREGTRFRVWAPTHARVELELQSGAARVVRALRHAADGTFSICLPALRAVDRYAYRLDGEGPYPDPASRFQPEGVHGASAIVDATQFVWSDGDWRGITPEALVIYEMHVGTFTPAGRFAAAAERLTELVALGVTAIELMPVADFAGERNWGYDGVALFAPARCYGTPDDLRRLVNTAHGLGLAVLLDVVYNHLGPDGAYLSAFSPYYFSPHHHTPWGAAVNLDGDHNDMVRAFFIENALHWIHEYHIDGLRLDATHALIDDSPRHFLADLSIAVHGAAPHGAMIIAEDRRNLALLLRPLEAGGWGLDGVWADDFHHQLRRFLAGDHEGYYEDYRGSLADLATTIHRGWFYCGQHSLHLHGARGTDPEGIPPRQFVFCLQNHDQIGNRAFGERLHHQIDPAVYRAASVLLLCVPQTPLLFMGQEWAASSPFLYFSDHHAELGKQVTAGRRREFRDFSAFAAAAARARIPDPQALTTFLASILRWAERADPPHAATLALYRTLLHLRRCEPALRSDAPCAVAAIDETTLTLRRDPLGAASLLAVVQLRHGGEVALEAQRAFAVTDTRWDVVLTSEEPRFALDAQPIGIDLSGTAPLLQFHRPGAVILKACA